MAASLAAVILMLGVVSVIPGEGERDGNYGALSASQVLEEGTEMSLADARSAIEAFVAAIHLAQGKAAHGAFGEEFDELLRHAGELLDLVDEALLRLDHKAHRDVFAAAPVLRAKLEALRERVRADLLH